MESTTPFSDRCAREDEEDRLAPTRYEKDRQAMIEDTAKTPSERIRAEVGFDYETAGEDEFMELIHALEDALDRSVGESDYERSVRLAKNRPPSAAVMSDDV